MCVSEDGHTERVLLLPSPDFWFVEGCPLALGS